MNKPLTEQDFIRTADSRLKGEIINGRIFLEKVQSARNGAIQEIKDFEIFNPILEKRIIAILNKWFNIGD
jgi:hypothetical protein